MRRFLMALLLTLPLASAHEALALNVSGEKIIFPVIGRFPGSDGTVNVAGGTFAHTMPARNIIVGEEGTGTLTVSGTGAVAMRKRRPSVPMWYSL